MTTNSASVERQIEGEMPLAGELTPRYLKLVPSAGGIAIDAAGSKTVHKEKAERSLPNIQEKTDAVTIDDSQDGELHRYATNVGVGAPVVESGKDVESKEKYLTNAELSYYQTETGFSELYRRYCPFVLAFARRILSDVKYDEDVAQEVFLRAARSIDRFNGMSSVKSWLGTITVREVGRMGLRNGRNGMPTPEETIVSALKIVDDHAEPIVVRNELLEAMSNLPVASQKVLILTVVEERSTEETAEIMGISKAAVKTAKTRALRQLHDVYFMTSDGVRRRAKASRKLTVKNELAKAALPEPERWTPTIIAKTPESLCEILDSSVQEPEEDWEEIEEVTNETITDIEDGIVTPGSNPDPELIEREVVVQDLNDEEGKRDDSLIEDGQADVEASDLEPESEPVHDILDPSVHELEEREVSDESVAEILAGIKDGILVSPLDREIYELVEARGMTYVEAASRFGGDLSRAQVRGIYRRIMERKERIETVGTVDRRVGPKEDDEIVKSMFQLVAESTHPSDVVNREILDLRFSQGKSIEEIATLLDMKKGAVQRRISRTKSRVEKSVTIQA